jgi:lipoate-protein ligase B
MTTLTYLDVGRAPYAPTLRLQERLVAEVKAADPERAYLVLVEHEPPVITLGRGADAAHVVASAARLRAEGIELHPSSRGGDVTYHGPGQLVGYPILRLDLHGRDVHRYLRDLEEVLIRLLARFGIEGGRVEGQTGVWVGCEKVAAIGVAIRRWVTYHGFALNVCPDLRHFDLIVPCGIRGKGVTSLEKLLGRPVPVAEVKAPLVECMLEVFGFAGASAGEAHP